MSAEGAKSTLYIYPENPNSHKWILGGLEERRMSTELKEIFFIEEGEEKSILAFETDSSFLRALYDFKVGGEEDALRFTEFIEYGYRARKWKLQRPGVINTAKVLRSFPGMNKKEISRIIRSGRLQKLLNSLCLEEV
jgi:hypothetical protein